MKLSSAMIAISTAICILGCGGKGTNPPSPPPPDYFPLAVGNKWTYVYRLNGVARGTAEIEVIGKVALPNGLIVYDFGLRYPRYARKTNLAIEWYTDLSDSDPDCLWPLPFEVGREFDDCKPYVRVSARDTVTVPAGTFDDCYRIDLCYGNQAWDSGYVWLALNTGPVMISGQTMVAPPDIGTADSLLISYELH